MQNDDMGTEKPARQPIDAERQKALWEQFANQTEEQEEAFYRALTRRSIRQFIEREREELAALNNAETPAADSIE